VLHVLPRVQIAQLRSRELRRLLVALNEGPLHFGLVQRLRRRA
jgi:hypothetical protein